MIRKLALFAALAVSTAAHAQTASPAQRAERAARWWTDISAIADDANAGRLTGSAGYDRAADYVVRRFKAEGLAPAGEKGGYTQVVAFREQQISQAAQTAALVKADGTTDALKGGVDFTVSSAGAPRPTTVDAPLVFVGYGLHMPERGHDDFKGVDLKGKIAVVIAGGPADLPGTEKASARNERNTVLAQMGAAGVIAITPPKQVEIPWARATVLANAPGMFLADAALRETPDGLYTATFDPAQGERLFAGSGHSYAEIAAASDASRPIAGFDMKTRLKGTVTATYRELTSHNLIAALPGSDPKLKTEYVAISAHLDHLGTGTGPDGKTIIYPGAMDDASGVASLLDIVGALKAGPPLKRSVLVVVVTAEEKGLLGSHYFANRPTVPKASLVADLNFDMPLPLWTLKTVLAQGENESTLGAVARASAAEQGLALTPDPLPDRNSFVRTDQYSFVKQGLPSLAFKFGFQKDTPEFEVEKAWRANRYHAAGDDLSQPVMKEEAIKLDDVVAGIARRVANDPVRPTWLETSGFRKFAR